MFKEFIAIAQQATVTIQVWELSLALIAVTLCLVLKLNRLGLVMAFLFVFHMGWMFFKDELMRRAPEFETWGVFYLICGAAVLLLVTANAIIRPHDTE